MFDRAEPGKRNYCHMSAILGQVGLAPEPGVLCTQLERVSSRLRFGFKLYRVTFAAQRRSVHVGKGSPCSCLAS